VPRSSWVGPRRVLALRRERHFDAFRDLADAFAWRTSLGEVRYPRRQRAFAALPVTGPALS